MSSKRSGRMSTSARRMPGLSTWNTADDVALAVSISKVGVSSIGMSVSANFVPLRLIIFTA